MQTVRGIFLTVDTVMFTVKDGKLEVLLIKRAAEPYRGMWAVPGGFLREEEEIEECVKRQLYEETGIRKIYLEQLYTNGRIGRDPRGRVVTIVYYALIDSTRIKLNPKSQKASEACWFQAEKLPELAFDHRRIISDALCRIRNKIEYTNIAFQLLPKKFTLSELQKVYETVLGKKLDKRNFRKKVKEVNILLEYNETKMVGIHRPAKLYSFRDSEACLLSPQKRVTG
jgi:8-oxo-dGTP diphosphatase